MDVLNPSLKEAAQAVYLLSEAEKIAAALREARIPAVFVKGIALLETVYPDLHARPISDMDLVVDPNDVVAAAGVLNRLGYSSKRTLEFLKPAAMPARADLHPGLWFFDARRFWEAAVPKRLGAEEIRIPAPEYLMLHALLHTLLQDGKISETAREDARRLAAMPDWDWEKFWNLAEREGWSRPAAIFAAEVLEKSRTEPDLKLKSILFSRAVSPYRKMWLAQDFWGNKWRLAWQVLFPSNGFLAFRYPKTPRIFLKTTRLFHLAWTAFSRRFALN